jgi:ABC-type transport system involved in multi-copper enzyme maturation permease subunit
MQCQVVIRMTNLIHGEIYRLLHKKSMYIYFGALVLAYFAVAFIRSSGFDAHSLISEASNLFFFLPSLVGGYLFAAIYTDDLSAKSLSTLVGFGIGKTKIVLAKLVVMALASLVAFAAAPLVLYLVLAILGWVASAGDVASVFLLATKYLLMTLAYAALCAIAVYGLQRTTFAMVLYVLLSFNVIGGLLTMLFTNLAGPKLAPLLIDRLIPGITDRILEGLSGITHVAFPAIEYVIFMIAAVALSILAFRWKEMEF